MEGNIIETVDEKKHLKIIPYYTKFGLIATFLGIIFSIIILFVGLEHHQSIGFAAYLIPILTMISCLSTYKSDNDNRLLGGTGFKMGFLMFLFYGILSALFMILYVTVINPDFTEGLIEKTIEKMEDRGLSDEMIEQQMSFSKFFFTTQFFFISSIIISLMVGVTSSGIASAIMKTKTKN